MVRARLSRQSGRDSVKVTVVGQRPPPYHGQAVMIETLLATQRQGLELRPVRMAFSRTVNENGKPGLRKALQLAPLIARILLERVRGARVLYYPPSGDDLIPVARDLVVLIAARWAFLRTVLHFLAGGHIDLYERWPGGRRRLLDLGYGRPDAAVQLTMLSPPDGEAVRARRIAIIPNGIADPSGDGPPRHGSTGTPRILFVAFLRPPKGVEVLLQAAGILAGRGVEFGLDIVGEPDSPDYDRKLRDLAEESGIREQVRFHGILIGEAKNDVYRRADIFCFPSYYGNENLPVVLLEAMAFGLPIVTTRWRGLPDAVTEGETGLLVPVHDPTAVADALQRLIVDADLRARLGEGGRARFSSTYSLEVFQQQMGDLLEEIGGA